MIFAGMDGGLPCFVGRFINFSKTGNRPNYISFGGQSAECGLNQYEVYASRNSNYLWQYFDGSGNRSSGAFIEMFSDQNKYLVSISTDLLSIGSSESGHSFLEYLAPQNRFICARNYAGGYATMEYSNSVFGTYVVNQGDHGGCVLKPWEGSVYAYVSNNGTNFASLDASYGRLSAGVDTGYGGVTGSNSAFAQMGQLDNGYFGFYVQSYYNQLSWVLNPNDDELQFYLANNNQMCRVGMTARSNEASVWAYNVTADANFLWDGGGRGTLNLYSQNNSLQFYPKEGSFWCYNGISQNQIKFDMRNGLLQLWNSTDRYINLWLYMLESNTTATFHYVYSGRDINGNLIHLKDAQNRNVKVLATAPIILSGNSSGGALCAIDYGV